MESNGYQVLIEKLDLFIRKYYKNLILRGGIYGAAIIAAFFLTVVLLEYFGHFSSGGRTVLSMLFLGVTAYTVVRFIALPTLKLFRLGKQISHEEAAKVVGTHFGEVKDKLLNTLQLKRMADHLPRERELILAGIEQRTAELRPVPFQAAIDFTANRKYLKYALPPVALLAVLLFAAPNVLRESAGRLVNFNKEIVAPAPYSIEILNEALQIPELSDFELRARAEGRELPDKLYVRFGDSQYLMRKEGKNEFSYTMKSVRESVEFQFYGSGHYSELHELGVIPLPRLLSFEAAIDYPDYTGLRDQVIANTGDFEVPAGSKIRWRFSTKHTESLYLAIGDSVISGSPDGGEQWLMSMTAKQTESYSLITENRSTAMRDSVAYTLTVKPDYHPLITVSQSHDTLLYNDLFFTGELRDDYGFSKLQFKGTVTSGGTPVDFNISLPVPKNVTSEKLFHHWDLSNINPKPGDRLEYYFEVWDNDVVNGPKSARSALEVFELPSEDEIQEKEEADNNEIKDALEESLKEAKEIQKELELFKKELLEKKEPGWQDKKRMEDLIKRQSSLDMKMENLKRENERKNELKNRFQNQEERIVEKQQKLQELFDQLMNEELQKLMEELQKLMEELSKEDLNEELDKMKFDNEQLENELDKALEQFKQLEWEQKMEDTIKELEKLSEEQEKLSQKSEEKDPKSEELKKEQDALNDKFEQVKDDLEKLEKLNEDLEYPNQMPETEEQQESIENDMKESSDKLEQKQKSKASKSQKSAAGKMKEMAQKMGDSMAQSGAEKQEEDMEALRALLENIITLSFDQEQIMSEIKPLDAGDPKYVELGKSQRKLRDDTEMVEDSLLALAKRVMAIEPIVLQEIGLIRDNVQKAMENISERLTPKVAEHQQYAMTSFNNLALLLDEALRQMQKDASCSKPGTGNCEKPGGMGSKPSMSDMKKQQEALSKKMQKMKEQLAKGNNDGKNNDGKGAMSKELAESAAKQAAIRKEIERMADELNKDGSGAGQALKEIAKEMEEAERDFVNKNIVDETIQRQQDILTRLLEAENAEREREQDNKRKSNEAQEMPKTLPPDMEEFKRKKEKESEFYRSLPPELRPYYKSKVNEYFNNLDR